MSFDTHGRRHVMDDGERGRDHVRVLAQYSLFVWGLSRRAEMQRSIDDDAEKSIIQIQQVCCVFARVRSS